MLIIIAWENPWTHIQISMRDISSRYYEIGFEALFGCLDGSQTYCRFTNRLFRSQYTARLFPNAKCKYILNRDMHVLPVWVRCTVSCPRLCRWGKWLLDPAGLIVTQIWSLIHFNHGAQAHKNLFKPNRCIFYFAFHVPSHIDSFINRE